MREQLKVPVKIKENSITIGQIIDNLIIETDKFPVLLSDHLNADPTTQCIEEYAAQLIVDRFPIARVHRFIRVVCKWGNDNRIGYKVTKNNDPQQLHAALIATNSALARGNPREAISEITKLKGLGISFGSKHLKFLDPCRSVVLDSIIRKHLHYENSIDGYLMFLNDCSLIASHLNARGIVATARRQKWRPSDVEMAIFMKVSS
jgi:hypothetical protein